MYRSRIMIIAASALLAVAAGCDKSDEEEPAARSGVGEAQLAEPGAPQAPATGAGAAAPDRAAEPGAPGAAPVPGTEPAPGAAPAAPGTAGPPPGAHGGAGDMAGTPPTGEVTGAELDKFVEAVPKVQAVQEKYAPRINSATSQEEAQRTQRQALGEIEEALDAAGLTTVEYAMLAERIDGDPALQQRVQTRLAQQGQN
jgi:hypothetical protein